MTEKQLKQLVDKIDVNHPMANVIRSILNQFVAIKQTKLTINALCTQYKIDDLYKEVMAEDKE